MGEMVQVKCRECSGTGLRSLPPLGQIYNSLRGWRHVAMAVGRFVVMWLSIVGLYALIRVVFYGVSC